MMSRTYSQISLSIDDFVHKCCYHLLSTLYPKMVTALSFYSWSKSLWRLLKFISTSSNKNRFETRASTMSHKASFVLMLWFVLAFSRTEDFSFLFFSECSSDIFVHVSYVCYIYSLQLFQNVFLWWFSRWWFLCHFPTQKKIWNLDITAHQTWFSLLVQVLKMLTYVDVEPISVLELPITWGKVVWYALRGLQFTLHFRKEIKAAFNRQAFCTSLSKNCTPVNCEFRNRSKILTFSSIHLKAIKRGEWCRKFLFSS